MASFHFSNVPIFKLQIIEINDWSTQRLGTPPSPHSPPLPSLWYTTHEKKCVQVNFLCWIQWCHFYFCGAVNCWEDFNLCRSIQKSHHVSIISIFEEGTFWFQALCKGTFPCAGKGLHHQEWLLVLICQTVYSWLTGLDMHSRHGATRRRDDFLFSIRNLKKLVEGNPYHAFRGQIWFMAMRNDEYRGRQDDFMEVDTHERTFVPTLLSNHVLSLY